MESTLPSRKLSPSSPQDQARSIRSWVGIAANAPGDHGVWAIADAIGHNSLLRDVAISELLVVEASDEARTRIALEIYAASPGSSRTEVAALVLAVAAHDDVNSGLFHLAAEASRGSTLAGQIRRSIRPNAQSVDVAAVGALTETTGKSFTLSALADQTETFPVWRSVTTGGNWNGFAAPDVTRETLSDFLDVLDNQGNAHAFEGDRALTWSTVDLPHGHRPAHEDVTVLAPSRGGLYALSGYQIDWVGDVLIDPEEVWNVVNAAVETAQEAWLASQPVPPSAESLNLAPGAGTSHQSLAL